MCRLLSTCAQLIAALPFKRADEPLMALATISAIIGRRADAAKDALHCAVYEASGGEAPPASQEPAVPTTPAAGLGATTDERLPSTACTPAAGKDGNMPAADVAATPELQASQQVIHKSVMTAAFVARPHHGSQTGYWHVLGQVAFEETW